MTDTEYNVLMSLVQAIANKPKKPTIQGAIPQYLTVDQAAQMLGVHRRTIERYIEQGVLRKFKVKRNTRLLLSDVEAVVQNGSTYM